MRDRIINASDQDRGGGGATHPLDPDPLGVVGREAEATASAVRAPATGAVDPVTPEVPPAVLEPRTPCSRRPRPGRSPRCGGRSRASIWRSAGTS